MLKFVVIAAAACLAATYAQEFRFGCLTDLECGECRFDSYCLNYPYKQPPFVCHGDSVPRYFPGCSFSQ